MLNENENHQLKFFNGEEHVLLLRDNSLQAALPDYYGTPDWLYIADELHRIQLFKQMLMRNNMYVAYYREPRP